MSAWGAIGAAVGDIASKVGLQMMQNKANKKEANRTRSFQERMSRNSYLYGMEDMKKSGLNPILAYSQGGATMPSGATAQMSMPTDTDPVASAYENKLVRANIDKLKEEARLTSEKTNTEMDQQTRINEEVRNIKVLTDRASQDVNSARMNNEVKRAFLEATKKTGSIKSNNQLLQYIDILTESAGKIFGSGQSGKNLFKGK